MKAMILAAGMGTRLRPLTNDRPKALVEVAGRTLLEITLSRMREFGVRQVIINVHHFAPMIVDYLAANKYFGMHIEISLEESLLDSGGGLKKATGFLSRPCSPSEAGAPFILHNVDVISTIDIDRMKQFHLNNRALATLAVQDRETSRYLLFDENHQLCGRRAGREGTPQMVRPARETRAQAFSGIHMISPGIFSLMSEQGSFSIIDCYLRLAAKGQRIMAFRADEYYWRDLGRPESVALAKQDLARGLFGSHAT